jgi:hypothetical protein
MQFSDVTAFTLTQTFGSESSEGLVHIGSSSTGSLSHLNYLLQNFVWKHRDNPLAPLVVSEILDLKTACHIVIFHSITMEIQLIRSTATHFKNI